MSFDLDKLAEFQADYDSRHWEHDPGMPTIAHLQTHIAKLGGKVATAAELYGHGVENIDLSVIKTEVVPDLLIFALRLANTLDMDLDLAYRKRTVELVGLYTTPETPLEVLDADGALLWQLQGLPQGFEQ